MKSLKKIQDFASDINHYDSDDFTPPESCEAMLSDPQGIEWLDGMLKHCVALAMGKLEEIAEEEKALEPRGQVKQMFKRLTRQSEAFDGFTLKELCESCSEMGCGEYCEMVQGSDCKTCSIQEAFNRLAQYEDIGSAEEFTKLVSAKAGKQSAEYLVEAIGSETKHIIDLLMAEAEETLKQIRNDPNACPCCGLTVIHTGGCVQCPDPACGWSKCG